MKHPKSKRGQMRVIEVLVASFIVMFALSFVTAFATTPNSPRLEVADLEKMGYSALLDYDNQELLAPLVYGQSSQNWTALNTFLKIALPVDVNFNLTIYRTDWTIVNSDKIIYGDETSFDSSRNIATVSYVLSGYRIGTSGNADLYDPRILLLQLSRG